MSFLEKLLPGNSLSSLDYEEQKKLAIEGKLNQRLALAKNKKTNQEILFYLAENDPDDKVRQAVAQNEATPLHASSQLAIDSSQDVRLALAGRLVKLLPDLSIDDQSKLYAYAVQALGTLALDEVLKIRKSLASSLKDYAYAPPGVVAQLARDIEREVAEPILRFCVALKDEDIVEILRYHPQSWAAEAVAQRPKVNAKLSRAVIESGHATAGKYLLENKGAIIDHELLYEIIDRAKEFPEWHEPLATHHKLSDDMVQEMARYVDARIRKILQEKGEYDLITTEIITEATRRRMALEEKNKSMSGDIMQHVRQLKSAGKLTEEIISDQLALRNHNFLMAAFACLLNTNQKTIDKIFKIKKAAPICSICWKSGLSMRFSFKLQQEVAHIPPKELIYPKGGSDYPLEEKDMIWQLEFFGIEND